MDNQNCWNINKFIKNYNPDNWKRQLSSNRCSGEYWFPKNSPSHNKAQKNIAPVISQKKMTAPRK